MNRAEALKIGTIIANRWWKYNKPIILSKQRIETQKKWQQIKKRLRRQALSRKQNTSKEMLPHEKRTFHSRSIFD